MACQLYFAKAFKCSLILTQLVREVYQAYTFAHFLRGQDHIDMSCRFYSLLNYSSYVFFIIPEHVMLFKLSCSTIILSFQLSNA